MPSPSSVLERPAPVPATPPASRHEQQRSEAGALLRSAVEGDEAAWTALVERFSSLLWSVTRTYRMGGAERADAIQCTWMQLHQHGAAIRQPEQVGAWLVTTLRRECLRRTRTSVREWPTGDGLALEPPPAPGSPVEQMVLQPERDALLWRAVDSLPERQRSLLHLLMADPAPSYGEISAALGIPVGAIGPTRARALARLRAMPEVAGLLSA